jgi:hypothetical protein
MFLNDWLMIKRGGMQKGSYKHYVGLLPHHHCLLDQYCPEKIYSIVSTIKTAWNKS